MLLRGAPDGVDGDRHVERYELPATPHGEREQVEIGELARSMNSGGIADIGIEGAL